MQMHAAIFAKQLSLQQLQRRFEKLRSLQSRIGVPPADQFEAYEKSYLLPLKARDAQLRSGIPQHALEYLSGFFDGDGCASNSKGCCRLTITQSIKNAKVLLFFRNLLGGGIYAGGRSFGSRRTSVRWEISGARAIHAAAILGSVPSCKQTQLQIVSAWSSQKSVRLQAGTDLRAQKLLPPRISSCPSWAFLAGFFDAEGCIEVQPHGYLRLRMSQKYVPVLHAVRDFLITRGFGCTINEYWSHAILDVNRTEVCREVLRNLLRAGLRVKREAARTALQMSAGNFHEVRAQVHALVGNQARYSRLTVSGVQRAYQIRFTQSRLRSAVGAERAEITSHLAKLQDAHGLQCALERYLLVRADIKRLLQQGVQRSKINLSLRFHTYGTTSPT